jgi:hypothetical protein
VLHRLVCSPELAAAGASLTPRKLGGLLYDNWVFDTPKLLDFCRLYHLQNPKVAAEVVAGVFALQPLYWDDLHGNLALVKKALDEIGLRFCAMPRA